MANNIPSSSSSSALAHQIRHFLTDPMELHLHNRVLLHCSLAQPTTLRNKLVASASPHAPVVRPPPPTSAKCPHPLQQAFDAYANVDTSNQGDHIVNGRVCTTNTVPSAPPTTQPSMS